MTQEIDFTSFLWNVKEFCNGLNYLMKFLRATSGTTREKEGIREREREERKNNSLPLTSDAWNFVNQFLVQRLSLVHILDCIS